MVRSMYSGVAGMKAHQTRMDVIGNNISNVNTYGFKGSRATFRDVYYQSMRGASAASGSKGGINPSQVGYGSTTGSIDVLQTAASLSTTGNPLDLAIAGEGFFQVMDSSGNKFFTRAGMLDIDAAGNLTDVNGNFVLGTAGKSLGVPAGNNKIQFSIPAVDPAASSAVEEINNIKYTISAQNNTTDGNVSFQMITATDLPDGENVSAVVDGSGNVTVRLNAKSTFTSLATLGTAVNAAITKANGAPHPAGNFTITSDKAFPIGGLTGAEIAGNNFNYKLGSVPIPPTMKALFPKVSEVGNEFKGTGAMTYSFKDTYTAGPPASHSIVMTATDGTNTYTSIPMTSDMMEKSGSVVMRNGTSDSDCFTIQRPSLAALKGSGLVNNEAVGDAGAAYTFGPIPPTTELAVASAPSKDLGLNKNFKLGNGTKGGPQTVKDLSSIGIGADGVVTAVHGILGNLNIGRIDLVTFENSQGLQQSGNTYFAETSNSGAASPVLAGTGGAGSLAQSTLELANVDLAQEFSDMIVTQRGFQANSRLINVSDTMLEELINLKR